jgi:hypothetical protein
MEQRSDQGPVHVNAGRIERHELPVVLLLFA